jgi:acetyl esterase/lipase
MKPLLTVFAWMRACAIPALLLSSSALRLAATDGPPPIPTAPAQEEAHPSSVALWDQGAPGSEARKDEPERVDWRQEPDIVFPVTYNIHHPSITPFLPAAGRATGAAIIVAPGGGHMFLTMDREGYDVGQWLADHGIAAFVLKYRLARDKAGRSPYQVEVNALADGQRAIRLVRSRAGEWGVDPARIGFLGFSAGGELAVLVSTRSDAGHSSSADPVERASSRPDFTVLGYPGISPDKVTITKDQPPVFLFSAFDDARTSITNATLFLKYRAAGVPAEIHVYSEGGHGFGVRRRPMAVSDWPDQLVAWMRDRGYLKR